MGKELPPGVLEKYLAISRYQGDKSEIAVTAYKIYLARLKNNVRGSALDDWAKAEEVVGKKFVLDRTNVGDIIH